MIRELAGSIERTVEKIEEEKEMILVTLYKDQVDELWEHIWQLPEGQKKAYLKVYKKQVESWRKRIMEVN